MNNSADRHLARATKAIHEGEFVLAASEFRAAIELGNQWAKIGFALMHIAGDGFEPNGRTAEALLLEVASNASAPREAAALAFNNLSTLYVVGAVGLEPDAERAAECALKAKALGFDAGPRTESNIEAARIFASEVRSAKKSFHVIGHKGTDSK